MVSIQADPANPDKLILTAAVTLYVDRVLTDVLSAEVAAAIRNQAIKDLTRSVAVRKAITAAAQVKLLQMLTGEKNDD